MYNTNVWMKYLPVLRVVLKRAVTAEQRFALNTPDFTRAGYTRKSGYKFLLNLKEGRLDQAINDMPLASQLLSALQGDEAIRELLVAHHFHISLSSKYELTIKHLQQYKAKEEKQLAEAE